MSFACETCPVRDRAACAVLSEQEREELARTGRRRRLQAGQTLFAAGEERTACATLVSGALKISATDADGDERILALVHPAGLVGELFQPFAHYDVVALSECELCVFSGAAFDAAVGRSPELARALLRRTQEDLHASRALLALSGRHSARQKVAGLVLAFANSASDSPCHPAARFDLPISRGDIGNMLGLTIETVSRQLSGLARESIIRKRETRGIELLDPARLSRIAAGSEV